IANGIAMPPKSRVGNIMKCWDLISRDQFTGLLDKNGTKIFEGDIIKSSPRCSKDTGMFNVHYDCVYASFTCHHIEWLGLCVSSPESYPLGECRFDIEVIGNIHEAN
ncbi:MAG TPA: hypothetical protein DDW91_17820, partial [Shewanella frigidimarina]|nr:hypothetical protein [Shewanella frigidimarina]